MVTGPFDVRSHAKISGENCTVRLDPGEPGAAMIDFTGDVLLDVVVTHTGWGLNHFLSVWISSIFAYTPLLSQWG